METYKRSFHLTCEKDYSVVLSPPKNKEISLDEHCKQNAQLINKGVTWAQLQEFIRKNVETKSEVYTHLKKLRILASELSGGDQSQDVVDAAAIFLLKVFCGSVVVSQKQLLLLRQMFGQVSLNKAGKVLDCVQNISSLIPDGLESVLKQNHVKRKSVKKLFSLDTPPVQLQRTGYIDNKYKLFDITSKVMRGGEARAAKEFSMNYDEVAALLSSNKEEPNKVSSCKKLPTKNGYGKSWLENEISKYYDNSLSPAPSLSEFCESIVAVLRSERNNDELQNELFDLLGFDRFELIELLLKHRDNITHGFMINEEKKITSAEIVPDQKRPALGCQVIVQSEQEKQLLKLARKEEKKLNKLVLRTEDNEDEPELNISEMRVKRHVALKAAEAAPLFPVKSTSSRPKEVYPNVYDSQREAQQTAGFISGQKMMLPANVERKDTKLAEEVFIPVAPPIPVKGLGELVKISTLDEIGQMAFSSVKTLNRIQSIVFDTAYHTNENLLICAPTGAGKTNVALLTVVHQIKQFIENGVIKRDQFKIVYVAPMKALAAEMTRSFSKKLNCLGIVVKELTGDMQLTKKEILETQMLVTTPEKWDVVTRKGTGDIALSKLVKLLIIDEVHLLHGDRGPVVEALVARTLRLVESSQSMIRIVGLSATLPNYIDVARFLRVNPYVGLFFFDSRFRPVPLSMEFVGVKALNPLKQLNDMDQVCYDKVIELVRKGHQVMVFVHARNATVRTATVLKELASQKNHLQLFEPQDSAAMGNAKNAMAKSRNKQLADLFPFGFSVHHAGMMRSDRSMVEKYFGDGLIKVLVCTSTLAWGVNLPAHGVIIRDVLQIFGRAGRPQFDKSGHGVIITSHDKLSHYLSLLTNQFPIESNFLKFLADNLNAEVTLGTISNVDDAVQWLSYTYLFVRMRLNPHVYGIDYHELMDDPTLEAKRREFIHIAAQSLDKARMIRYDNRTGDLSATDLGRTASHFYIKYDTIEVFNEMMMPAMNEPEILNMISQSTEFEQLKVRDDELDELDNLQTTSCAFSPYGGSENLHGKINILLQTFLSRGKVSSFSLLSDLAYITQNAVRIVRSLFEIVLRQNRSIMAARLLAMSKMFEQQQWTYESPMRQFRLLDFETIRKLEERRLSVENLREMDTKEITALLRHPRQAELVKRCAWELPMLTVEASLQPITRSVLRITLQVNADFRWNDKIHGKTSENFYIWIEDPESDFIYHYEYFILTRKQVFTKETQELVMTIPLNEPLPPQYYVVVNSDRWLGSSQSIPLSFQHLILPESHPPHTDLLELQPLPVTALNDPKLEALFPFSHFNPIQTQIFHCLYHTDNNVLLGAPTGSGKTIAAEIAMFRVFREYPKCKVVYIAPLKALVRERIEDWKIKLEQKLGRQVVELTGDVSPDVRAIARADVIVTTPEKWDGISRSWQTRNYVQHVALIVIDEIHLLGEDRGPVLEVIVSRTNFIASHTKKTLRIIGLSTALANARDLAHWLEIGEMGLYNFRPSVRPVPLEVHISGFPGKHYCPRMATMNKPAFQAIRQHSPAQPALIFVSSRRQTRLTALDLIAYLAGEDDPKQWLHMPEEQMDHIISNIKDSNLKLMLAFGIGMHHAGLQERDRKTVEELFVNQKIQILVATATLAWGVNFPAHLVIIKGTEYYDGKLHRYVDMPITDVLQMMGRAGRPQYDDHGVAVVLVHDAKKNFYKKFLYEPFPVESSLLEVLPDHINAEIVAGTINTKQDIINYLTWTYFFRRLVQNPSYYHLEALEQEHIHTFLSKLVDRCLATLLDSYCVTIDEDERGVLTTFMGKIASYYYLSHQTMQLFYDKLGPELSLEDLLRLLSDTHEYEELPVRHNEDQMNSDLAKLCPLTVDPYTYDSPHTKAFLLFQAHFSRMQLPIADYYTDLKSVLDQAIRILQAMIDICAENGWLAATLRTQHLMQMVIQARWLHDSPLLTLPHIESHHLCLFEKTRTSEDILVLPVLQSYCRRRYESLASVLRRELDEKDIEQVYTVLCSMPALSVGLSIEGYFEENTTSEKEIRQPPSRDCWLCLRPGEEYILKVRLSRLNKVESRVHCPHFPRGKDEGWFLVLGNIDSSEVMVMKRISGIKGSCRNAQQLAFYTPKRLGRVMLTLFIMSDCYLGWDQQYNLQLDIVDSLIPLDNLPPERLRHEEKEGVVTT